MITQFWYTTLHNLTACRLPPRCRSVAAALARYHSALLTVGFAIVVGLIAVRFWP